MTRLPGLIAATLLLASAAGHAAQITPGQMARPEGPRSYLLVTPDHPQEGKHPLVILLHGHAGSAAQVLGRERIHSPMSAWLEIADREQLLLIAPDGMRGGDDMRGWNDCRTDAATSPHSDDVAFIAALIERAIAEQHADPARVYVMGMSNGGGMTYRLAVELQPRLAAFAAVAAPSVTSGPCVPQRPLSALIIHGTDDKVVPFNGGQVGGLLLRARGTTASAPDAVALWRKADQLSGAPQETVFPQRGGSGTRATRYLWGADPHQLQVEFIRVEHGGHSEPSIRHQMQWMFRAMLGKQSADLESAEEAWAFFRDKRAAPAP